jgi:ADP-heptose:LPS heptosyltransferase/glycosyltransferase involved in cell wall biosynthesis
MTVKYLISRPDKIGDVILALHGAKQLKCMLPEAEVYMHVSEYTADLVRNVRFIDGCVTLDEDLAPHKFDGVVDLMAKFSTARRYISPKIPIRTGNSARWFNILYNRTKYIRRSHALMSEAEHNWQLISLLDPRLKNTPLTESLNLDDFKEYVEFSDTTGFTALMPGISVSAHAWPLEHWIGLAKELQTLERQVLFILGPAESALKPKLLAALGAESPFISYRSFTDLKEVIGVLKSATNFVGPSTGITHLASAVGTPGVALYPTQRSMHPRRWKPFHSSLKVCAPASNYSAQDVLPLLTEEWKEESRFESPLLSAFIICKDEELNIRRAIESIKWADEILIVDSRSTDRTLDICREYPDVRIIERDWPGHREQKQFALEECRGKWVLNIDADEEVSMELRAKIQKILSLPEEERDAVHGYYLCRVVFFLEKWWDRSGWYPEYRMRFFQRAHATWGGVNPHEKALVKGPKKKLKAHLFHYTYTGFSDLMETLNRFSENSAQALYDQGERAGIKHIIFHPIVRFLKFMFIKRGYREGVLGFIVAGSQSIYTFLKYAKLWEIHYRKSHPSRSELLTNYTRSALSRSADRAISVENPHEIPAQKAPNSNEPDSNNQHQKRAL